MFRILGILMATLTAIAGTGIAIVLLAPFWPVLMIWAINALVLAGGVTTFAIPFTFFTWLSAFLILLMLKLK